jgi:hypothetical protein
MMTATENRGGLGRRNEHHSDVHAMTPVISLRYYSLSILSMSYPTRIKAVGINETGGVEVIQNLEVPFPTVKPTDLLIKVRQPLAIGTEARYFLARSSGLASTSSIPITGVVSLESSFHMLTT